MNEVSTDWNGLSMTYDVTFDDNYGFKNDTRGEYAAEVQVPGLGNHMSDPQVAQNVGEASFALLPPRKLVQDYERQKCRVHT